MCYRAIRRNKSVHWILVLDLSFFLSRPLSRCVFRLVLHRHFCLSLERCSVNQCNKRIISLIRVSAFVMPLYSARVSPSFFISSLYAGISIALCAFLIKLNLFCCHSNWKNETRPILFLFRNTRTMISFSSLQHSHKINMYISLFVCTLNLFFNVLKILIRRTT